MTLSTHLTYLEASGLLRLAQMEPELEYLFRHALIQDATYASLLRADRRVLHRAIAEVLERTYPNQLDELAPVLGRHYRGAGETERARNYFQQAGNGALRNYANREAEQHFRAALESSQSASDRAQALSSLGEALFWQGRFADAFIVWREAMAICQSGENIDMDFVLHLCARSARAASNEDGSEARSWALCQEGLQLAEGQPDTPGLALLLCESAQAAFSNGRREEARSFCQRAVSMAEALDGGETQVRALLTLSMILTLEDKNYTQAETTLRQALTLAEAAGNLRLVAQAHNYFGGFAHSAWGDYRAERDHRQQAAEAYRRMGTASHELNSLSVAAFCSILLGEFAFAEATLPRLHDLLRVIPGTSEVEWVALTVEIPLLRYQGEWEQAISRLLTYQAETRQRNDPDTLGNVDLSLGEIFLEQGEWSRAEEVLLEASECWKPLGWGTTWPLCLLSRVCARQGRVEEARRLLTEAREQAGPQPISGNELRLPLALAQLAVAEGNWPEAWAAFETATQLQTRRGLRWDYAQTLRQRAEALLARNESGDVDRARALLHEAQSEFETMHVPKYAALVHQRHLSLEI